MDNPLISVIVPCYNHASFLDNCLDSVLGQSFQNWECIIVSDGSTDNTEEVANRWVKHDPRFRYIYQNNAGPSAARNRAIRSAVGKWILPLDADNYINSEYLEKAIPYMTDNDIKIIYGEVKKFDQDNGLWKLPTFSLRKLASGNMIENCSFFRKIDWENVDGYDESLIYGLEDWEFWISILKFGGKVHKLKEVMLFYRITNTSRSNTLLEDDKLNKTLRYLEKKHFDFFYDNLGSKITLFDENANLKSRFNSKYYSFYNKFIDLLLKTKK